MRLQLVGSVLVLILSVVLTDPVEETTDKIQEEEEYEDIAVAESQDIAHTRYYSNDSDDMIDRPRSRPRGRKRRRRLRKRPRSTTPSFIEEYEPEKTLKEEETLSPEEEVVYQRRRPSKRRRRPIRKRPEYDTDIPESEIPYEPRDDRPPQEYHRPRNIQRRRRKGNRKRMRVTTESTAESNNETKDETLTGVTTQAPEVVMQSNSHSPDPQISSESPPSNQQVETTSSTFTPAFTPKEITEINHKLESLSQYQEPSESDYHVSGLGAFSLFQPVNVNSAAHNTEDNHIIVSSTTTKDYAWITRFDPQAGTKTTEEVTLPPTTTYKPKIKNEKTSEVKKEPHQSIKNIEKIIENRKNLFSTSKRLPPTSAVIRRRLRPRKHKNSTTTQETFSDNNIPTINPTNLNNDKVVCKSPDCNLNITSFLSNNIIPSSLLPSGFPTMPEILSPSEIIQKMVPKPNETEEILTTQSDSTDTGILNQASSNLIIITPSTLIRSQNDGENSVPRVEFNEIKILSEINEPVQTQTEPHTDIPTTIKVEIKSDEGSTSSPIETTPTISTVRTEKTMFTNPTIKPIHSSPDLMEEFKVNITNEEPTTESEQLKLDGIDVSNISDEILELIMDEMGKARVKRILELRNMTLSELIAHRERGAGHFSTFINDNKAQNSTNESTEASSTEVDTLVAPVEETSEEEQTEKMIVEKAKQFLNEYKKTDDSFSSVLKSSQRENEKLFQRMKVEGTVIPVPILEATHTSKIQFPEDGVLGAFPKYMYDIAGKQPKPNQSIPNKNPSLYTEPINKPKDIQQFNEKREPRVFKSIPRFSSEASSKENLEISPYPDWRISVSKSSVGKSVGFPGTSEEIVLVATSTTKTDDVEDVIILDEGDEVHHLRNHILGGNINIESRDITDEDYPEEKKVVPAGVKSAIAASGALLGLAIFGFLAVLVSCKIRQRRARLRARRDILCEHLAEDIRSSQRSHTPVLRKSPFNHGIHSNTASSRHYYLWRTLRKTFQYE